MVQVVNEPDVFLMRISDLVKDFVAFLCEGTLRNHRSSAGGTGFFVQVPSEDQAGDHCYLITAKHVIEEIQKGASDQVYVKINVRSQEHTPAGVRFIGIPFEQWRMHQDESVDLAVALWNPQPSTVFPRFDTISLGMLATPEFLERENIGIGDTIFYAGLFTSHQRTSRNIPVARMGHIAAMPEEPLHDNRGAFEAYLVETLSVGGFSGSPVFVGLESRHGPAYTLKDYGPWTADQSPPASRPDEPEYASLLGVLSGHFPHRQQYGMIHSGLSFVVPASKLRELLNQEDVMKERKRKEQKQRQPVTSLDAGFPMLTPEQFHQMLKRASRKHVPDQEKS